MAGNGWVSIHRKIIDHWIYDDPVKLKAWLTILLMVNYSPSKIIVKGTLFNVRRGESVRSLDTWAELFGKEWDKSKVRRFFLLLNRDNMIVTESERITTRLSVVNYDTWQVERNTDETQMKHKRNGGDTVATPNNKDNKKINHIVEFLNQATGRNYNPETPAHRTKITARLNEGYSSSDFEAVISHKAAEWLNDPDYSKYLRPETLFGDKFDGYLQDASNPQKDFVYAVE